MNIVLTLDEKLVADALTVAASRGLTFDELVAEELRRVTSRPRAEEMANVLEELWRDTTSRADDRTWNREALHDRPILS